MPVRRDAERPSHRKRFAQGRSPRKGLRSGLINHASDGASSMKPSPFISADPASLPRRVHGGDDPIARRDSLRNATRQLPLRMCVGPPISPSAELSYWRSHHHVQRFAVGSATYEDFEPAYRCGLLQYLREPFVPFKRAEPRLHRLWPVQRERSPLAWPVARFAALAAWERAQARAWAIARGKS